MPYDPRYYIVRPMFTHQDPDEVPKDQQPLEIPRYSADPLAGLVWPNEQPWYEKITQAQQIGLVAGGIILVALLLSR